MTVKDLLDQIAGNADDDSPSFRAAALRWLNLTRSYIADTCMWRTAYDPAATVATSATVTDGLYDIGSYEHISGSTMYDETNRRVILHESDATLQTIDSDKSTTGPPSWWSDAGFNTSTNQRQVYFWPIPDGTFTIRFAGYRLLSDIGTLESRANDEYFGPINPWAATFVAGMRYFHDLDNNEDVNQQAIQLRTFDRMIEQRRKTNELSPTSSLMLLPLRTSGRRGPMKGILDPGHFAN
jgi:hypothetical protein